MVVAGDMSIVEWGVNLIIWVISSTGYLGIIFWMALESACVPIPSEIIMPFSGFLVNEGRFTLLGITLAGTLGSLIGSLGAYWAGKRFGREVLLKHGKYLMITEEHLDRADEWFERHGEAAVFFGRMVPIVRTFISLPAGIAEMDLKKFAIYTTIGSLPWCLLLGYIGVVMGEHWDSIVAYFHILDAVVLVGFIIGAVWYYRKMKGAEKKES